MAYYEFNGKKYEFRFTEGGVLDNFVDYAESESERFKKEEAELEARLGDKNWRILKGVREEYRQKENTSNDNLGYPYGVRLDRNEFFTNPYDVLGEYKKKTGEDTWHLFKFNLTAKVNSNTDEIVDISHPHFAHPSSFKDYATKEVPFDGLNVTERNKEIDTLRSNLLQKIKELQQ